MFSAQLKARRKYQATEMYSKIYPERVEARMGSELKKARKKVEREHRHHEGNEETENDVDSDDGSTNDVSDNNEDEGKKPAGIGRSLWMKTWRRVVAEVYAAETEEVKAEIAQKLKEQEQQMEKEEAESKGGRTPAQYQGFVIKANREADCY